MKKAFIFLLVIFSFSGCSSLYFWQSKPKSELVKWHDYYADDLALAKEKLYYCELKLYSRIGKKPRDFGSAKSWEQEKNLFLARLPKSEFIRCQAAAIVVRNADKKD